MVNDRQRKAMFANMNKDNKFSYTPTYAVGDISAMGVDAIGTGGSVVVGAVPLLTGLGIGYVGADMILKSKERLEDKYKKEKAKSSKAFSQRLIEKNKTKVKRNRYSFAPSDGLEYYDYGVVQ